MTPQQFADHIERPASLLTLPLSELQQLALKFPYSANLRLLLLVKTRLEDHAEQDAYLQRCAAATFDRAHLYDLLRELETEQQRKQAGQGERLELKELDDLLLEPMEEESSTQLEPPPAEELARHYGAEDPNLTDAPFSETPPKTPSEEYQPSEEFLPEETPFEEIPPEEELSQEPTFAPPSSEEISQPEGLPPSRPEERREPREAETKLPTGLSERLDRIRRIQQQRGKDPRREVERIARRSLVAHEEVASETLADLHVRQGQYQTALKMYERLILLYPEKKAIFAGLIKELQEKL